MCWLPWLFIFRNRWFHFKDVGAGLSPVSIPYRYPRTHNLDPLRYVKHDAQRAPFAHAEQRYGKLGIFQGLGRGVGSGVSGIPDGPQKRVHVMWFSWFIDEIRWRKTLYVYIMYLYNIIYVLLFKRLYRFRFNQSFGWSWPPQHSFASVCLIPICPYKEHTMEWKLPSEEQAPPGTSQLPWLSDLGTIGFFPVLCWMVLEAGIISASWVSSPRIGELGSSKRRWKKEEKAGSWYCVEFIFDKYLRSMACRRLVGCGLHHGQPAAGFTTFGGMVVPRLKVGYPYLRDGHQSINMDL